MQREISNRVFLRQTTSPRDDVALPSAIDRTASELLMLEKKLKIFGTFQNWNL